jgi:glyoxylase-like metal-dependent hydrolase (beta-lactamase superfamily II)
MIRSSRSDIGAPTSSIPLGQFRLRIIPDRTFLIDGGSLFGVVPKSLWSRNLEADRENRILLGCNSLLVETDKEKIIIDLGLGDKYDEKAREIYGIKEGPTLMDSLEEIGEIDRIILTHLHFDHIGWITQKGPDGQIRLTFPQAEIIVQRREWEAANQPNELNRGTYLPENITPLSKADNLHLIDGDAEILPGIKLILTAGHSTGHQIVKIESEGKTALFWGDILPTTHHLRLPYIAADDIDPHTTLFWKKKLLPQAEREKWLNIFEHNPRRRAGYIQLTDPQKNRYRLLELDHH